MTTLRLMQNIEPDQYIKVVAAVIYHPQDHRILLSFRNQHQHQGGKWEFPGGKVQSGESLLRALARELEEELGIRCNAAQPLMMVRHSYNDKPVEIHFYAVRDWLGQATGREGQQLQWCQRQELGLKSFPEANEPLVNALSLGSQLLIWPGALPPHWEVRLHLALQRGVTLVCATEINDPVLLAQAATICHQHQARLLVANDPELIEPSAADGLHLTVDVAQGCTQRPDVDVLSIACENAAGLDHAAWLKADMVTLSSINDAASDKADERVDWQRFAALAQGRPFPVYAHGNVGPSDLPKVRISGGWGVAGNEKFWPLDQLLH